jgi:hypothetical protein
MSRFSRSQWFINGLDVMPKLTITQWAIVSLGAMAAFILVALGTLPH